MKVYKSMIAGLLLTLIPGALILAELASVTAYAAEPQEAPQAPQSYPGALAIREVIENPDSTYTLTGETASGILYRWTVTDEDAAPGDLYAVTMQDAGTPETALDDAVINSRYAGPAGW